MMESVQYRVKLPSYTFGEELFNSISHGIGAAVGVLGLVLMVLKASTPLAVVCAALFGVSIVITYTISCVYHALPPTLAGKRVVRVLDHCGVFLLVFGTYIPASLIGVGGALGWALFGTVCLFSIIGIVLTAIDVDRFSKAAVACHLVCGWSIVMGLAKLYMTCGFYGMALIVAGGLAYTVGAILYGLGRDRSYIHSVFHVFCLAGTLFHFAAIYQFML